MDLAKDLAKIVGKKQVIADKKALGGYLEDSSWVSGQEPVLAVRPQQAKEILEIVRLANEKRFPLIACSSQGPHTRGDTVPQADNAVIVDLTEMKNIVRVDKRNKVAMVEPGVTFAELTAAAAQAGLRVIAPLKPRRTKSVVGSLLEREPTTIPKYHWDMSDPLCCLEVVFGAGELFRTGAAAGPGTLEEQWAAGQAQKSPMGPAQTDWMKIIQASQGTMGIVSWASVKLELKPKREKAFFVGAEKLDRLIEFTYLVVQRKLADHAFILNRVQFAALNGEKPDAKLPAWILFYSLSGYEDLPEERIAYMEKDIADLAANQGVTVQTSLGELSAQKFLNAIGAPDQKSYWKTGPRGGFQDIFFLTTLDRTPEFLRIMEAKTKASGFAPENVGVYMQPIQQGRAVHVEFTLFYSPEEKEKALKLFTDASQAFSAAGGFFSRPYGPWAKTAYAKCPDAVVALKKVKGIVDPNGVLNPGKLCL